MNLFWFLALFIYLCNGELRFLGFPNVTTTCFTQWSFDFSQYFNQTCATGVCDRPTSALSVDLIDFGLRWDTDSTFIGGTTNKLAAETSLVYTLNTTVTLSDLDNQASGLLLITVLCPLTTQGVIPLQTPTSHTNFVLSLAPYIVNPLPDTPLRWSAQLPVGTGFSIDNNGLFTGAATSADTQYFATSKSAPVTVNYYSGPAANAATLALPLQIIPVGPRVNASIPDQNLTENVLYRQTFAGYFENPDGITMTFGISWNQTLAAALSFDTNQATISGTPLSAQVGTFPNVTICSTASSKSACSSFRMTVGPRARSPPVCTYPMPLIKRVGDYVSVDFNQYCRASSPAVTLTFTAKAPWHSPSGLTLTTSGIFSGVVSDNDAAQPQPLRLEVNVVDSDNLSTVVGLQLTATTVNHPPELTANASIAQNATERIYWEYSIVPWFYDPDGDNLTYQISPLYFDSRSAIKFNDQTGLFFGTPNAFDVSQKQYVWFLKAVDPRTEQSPTATMTLTIFPGPHGPTTFPIPLQPPAAYLGRPWSFDIKPFFFDSDGDVLTFKMSNPVIGSGLTLSNGVLAAIWSSSDVAQSEVQAARVTITADDGHNGTVDNYLFYSVIVPPTCNVPTIPAGILTGSGPCSTVPYQLDISKFCTSNFPITYNLQAPFPGLVLNQGFLSGPITELDVQAGRIHVTVNATTSRGASTVFTFEVPIQQPYALETRSCNAQQVQTCYQGYGCTIQLQPCFVAPNLCYQLGNGTQSSLRIGSTTGIVSGSVTDADIAQTQPISITVLVRDQQSGFANYPLSVRMLRASQVLFKPIPDLSSIKCGDPCCPWNPVDFVLNPTGNTSFTLEYGLPARSGISLNPTTGIFSGFGTLADAQASPMTLSVIVDQGLPTGPARMPPLTLQVIGTLPVSVIQSLLPFSTTVKVGTPMRYDAKQLFQNVDSRTSFALSTPGLRSLTIDPSSGYITGTVTDQEYTLNTSASSGIMTVTASVTADNSASCGGGKAQATLLLLVDPQYGAPIATGYPTQLGFCENVLLATNFGAYFTDPKQTQMTFTIQGLAPNTSLTWNPTLGLLKGTPGPADFAASPISAVVCARNIVGATSCINVQLAFLHGRRPPVIDPPIPSPVTAVVGQSFFGFFSRHFSDITSQPLIYSVSGLPVGSGMGIGPITGIFSGTPNEADFRATPLILTVFASNEQNVAPNNCSGMGGRARADFLMAITKSYSSPICDPLVNPYGPPSVGQFWLLDVSRSVRNSNGLKLEYALRGLPPGSGLTIDPQYGLLSGLITTADLKAQPLFISIAVTNGYGQCSAQLRLDIQPRSAANAPECLTCTKGNGGCQHRCVDSGIACSPTCSCNPGFSLQSDGKSCSLPSSGAVSALSIPVPVNSCSLNNGGCSQVCTNTQNAGVCSCRGSYALGADGRTCGYDPCSVNNGGCEQLCVPGTSKCGCRAGTLNPDGLTCAQDIVLVGTVPPALVLGCQNFMFDFSSVFRYQGGANSLAFGISGLPSGTGFRLSPQGMLSGTPTTSDCSAKQPMVLTVSASAQSGAIARAVMFVSAFCQISACSGKSLLPTMTSAPVVPEVWATVGQRTRFDVSKYFPGTGLTFYCLGLPLNSGLWMSPQGMLDGVPTRQDCENSLLGLTVVGRDSQGRESKAIISVKFNTCQSPRDLWPSQFTNQFQRNPIVPTAQNVANSVQIPSALSSNFAQQAQGQISAPGYSTGYSPIQRAQTFATFERSFSADETNMNIQAFAQCGEPFFYNVKDVFPVNGLSFSIDGLPSNSGFQISEGGVLTGSPSFADRNTSVLNAKITAVDTYGSYKTLAIRIVVSGTCADLNALSHLILPKQYASSGEAFRIDFSRIALTSCSNTTYGVRGLKPGSGLAINKGELSGNITNSACGTSTIQITADCGQQRTIGWFQLVVACSGVQSTPVINGQLPPAVGSSGQFFYYNVAPYMSSPDEALVFSLSTPSKNLVMSKTGVLSGYPTEADAGVITVTATNRMGTQIEADFNFRATPQTNSTVLTFFPLKVIQAYEGNNLVVDFSQRFVPRNSQTSYIAQGLRPGSGLVFDDTTGILSGAPNEVDVRQSQPMRITVIASPAVGQSSRGVVGITVIPSTPLLAPKGYSSSMHGTSLVSMPIPIQAAVQGEPFLLGVASAFFDQSSATMTYSLTGLVQGSGLTINSRSGVVSGTPTRADARALQPLALGVVVTNSNGEQVSEQLKLTIFQPKGQVQNQQPSAEASIPPTDAIVGQDFFLALGPYFSDPDGDALRYSLTGLTTKSGLRLDEASGTISGQPNAMDSKSSPKQLTVTAYDGLGGMTQQTFNLTVYQKARGITNNAPLASTMPRLSVSFGDNFNFAVKDYFSDPDGDKLTFRVLGLPDGTGFKFNSQTGRLTGSPTVADAEVKQPLVVGFQAEDGKGGRTGSILYLDIKSGVQFRSFTTIDDALVNASETSSVPSITIYLGVWTMFQTSRFFPFYQSSNKVAYIIAGFPANSGLKFDQSTGVLSGFAEGKDIAPNVPVTVSAQYYYNSSLVNTIEQPLFLRFLSAERAQNSPPVVKKIPDYRVDVNENVLLDVGSSFSDPDGDPLTFSVSGLPTGSGLVLVPSSGMLFGTPTQADLLTSDLLLTVIAEDTYHHRAQESFSLHFVNSSRGQLLTSTSCADLGWAVTPPATVCAQSPRFATGCPGLVNFSQAQNLCASLGARLCSPSELSDSRGVTTSNECTSKGNQMDPVWTSSTCAFPGAVITQAGTEKSCSPTTAASAKVKCCADSSHPKLKGSKRLPSSAKSCDQLNRFSVTPYATNQAICNYAPRKGVKCTNTANFTEARRICEDMGARLCSGTEIAQDLVMNAGCGVRGRIWSGIPCEKSGESFTQGGFSGILGTYPLQCTNWGETFPFVCCADFAPGASFSLREINVTDHSITVSWGWRAYSKVSVSYQKGGTRSSQWQGTQEIGLAQGRGSYTVNRVAPFSEYVLRVTPMNGRQLVRKQSAFVRVNTTTAEN